MIARDNYTRELANRAARARLKTAGALPHSSVFIGGREYAPGDRIIARRNDPRHDIDNGALGTIAAINPGSGAMIVQLDTGPPRTPGRHLRRRPPPARLRAHRPRRPGRHLRVDGRHRPTRRIHPRMGLHRPLPRPPADHHPPHRRNPRPRPRTRPIRATRPEPRPRANPRRSPQHNATPRDRGTSDTPNQRRSVATPATHGAATADARAGSRTRGRRCWIEGRPRHHFTGSTARES